VCRRGGEVPAPRPTGYADAVSWCRPRW
jgi:hypothetical protein